MHTPDFDFQTMCNTLSQCLQPLADWSAAHPRHTPLFVTIEYKVGSTRVPQRCRALTAIAAVYAQQAGAGRSSSALIMDVAL